MAAFWAVLVHASLVHPAHAQAPAGAAPSEPAPLSSVRPPGASSGASGGAGSAAAAQRAPKQKRPAAPGNLVGHGGPIKAIAVDPASAGALTGSFDYAMMVWDVSGEVPRRLFRLDDHDGAVNAVAFVPQPRGERRPARALAAGDDGTLTVWDLANGARVHRFEGHTAKIVGLAVSADGRWAATASWDRTARLWDLATLAPGPVLEGHRGPVNAAVFSADGSAIYTAGADGEIRRYRTGDGSLVRPLHRHGWGVNVLARLPGEERLVFGSLNGDTAILDPTAAETTALAPSHRPILALAAVEKPGLIAVGAGDGTIRVFRTADGSLLETYQNPYGPVWALAFRDGGTSLYYGGLDDFATLWQVTPRAPFEPVATAFPRRFQVEGDADDPIRQGEIQFARKCSICHTLGPDGGNRAGPTLYGIFGRRIATLPGYPFSEPLKTLDIVWTEETVAKLFELGPDVFTPGSKMPLQKMTDAGQRHALVAYLKATTVPNGGPAGEAGREAGGKASIDAGAPARQDSDQKQGR